jgi:hypothetical protein
MDDNPSDLVFKCYMLVATKTLEKIRLHLTEKSKSDPRKRERLRAKVGLKVLEKWFVEFTTELQDSLKPANGVK